MLKRILLSIVLLLVIAYLVVAITAFNRKPAGQVCRDMELVIKDTVYAGFITKKEVSGMLEKKGIYPTRRKVRCSPCHSDRKSRKVVCHEGFI